MSSKKNPAIPGPFDTVLGVLEKILAVDLEVLSVMQQQLAVLENIEQALVGEQVTDFTLEQTR